MKYSQVNINDVIIEDPIYNKKKSLFYSEIKLTNSNSMNNSSNNSMSDSLIDFIFETDKMKIKSIENNKLTVEFLDNHPKFYKFIFNFDRFIFKSIIDNGESWFGNKPNYNTIDRLFKRSIIQQESLTCNPTMEFHLEDECVIRDLNGDKTKLSELNENNEISCKVNIKQIFFLENQFYLDYIIEEIIVENYICQQTECLFSESD